MNLIRHPILQYGYVVNDIETACRHWIAMFGAGPFFHIPYYTGLNTRYRGKPAHDVVSHALGQAGPAQVQFTQQHNDAPSIWRDMYPNGGQGLHHIMIMVEDFEGEQQRFINAGCSIGEEFDTPMPEGHPFPFARTVYLDARALIGCFVEIYEENPVVRKEVEDLKALHESWDGVTDPIRTIHVG
ncbi:MULTISPECIES: VOC family protein [Sphingobium]|uniref:VOC family protein n=1 Tax=Sphingobium sp. MI1205 TaxID=407020 RepID=UPI0007700B2C|nr:VOC family protein [Sphingobium sp. MI1205]AMK19640.1 methylmalonyl-CoA epimerase [Sphingobium sp. MI1205]